LQADRVRGAGLPHLDIQDRRRPDAFEPRVLAQHLDAVSAASRQFAVFWLNEPTLIVSTIIQGPVIFTHDDDKMAKGEPCTTVYLWEPGKGRGEEVASFYCIPTARKAAPTFTLRTEPNLELGFGCILTEYQFAGDTEGHGVPSPPKLVKWAAQRGTRRTYQHF
jgi:hypothetical protein